MTTLHQSYTHIGNILSLKSDENALKNDIINNKIDWDQIVRVASDHLVLTTVYCSLNKKSLLEYIPEDLKKYLNDITSINRNRNTELKEEINEISTVLSKNNINHTFLKGSALLVLGYFEDYGERMIGDIDILVESNQINKAKSLLEGLNYNSKALLLSEKYQDRRHIPRLVNKNKLAAVEIHSQLLKKNHNSKLIPHDILNNKRIFNEIAVPNDNHLFTHNILSFQINDNGNNFNTIHFKNIYDGLIINKIGKTNIEFNNQDYNKFFLFSSLYLKDLIKPKKGFKNKILTHFFLLNVKSRFFKQLNTKLTKSILYFKVLLDRLVLFFINSDYRKDLLFQLKNKN